MIYRKESIKTFKGTFRSDVMLKNLIIFYKTHIRTLLLHLIYFIIGKKETNYW